MTSRSGAATPTGLAGRGHRGQEGRRPLHPHRRGRLRGDGAADPALLLEPSVTRRRAPAPDLRRGLRRAPSVLAVLGYLSLRHWAGRGRAASSASRRATWPPWPPRRSRWRSSGPRRTASRPRRPPRSIAGFGAADRWRRGGARTPLFDARLPARSPGPRALPGGLGRATRRLVTAMLRRDLARASGTAADGATRGGRSRGPGRRDPRRRRGARCWSALRRDDQVLRRDVLAPPSAGPRAELARGARRHGRPVFASRPLDGAEPVLTVPFGEALPAWRVALYQPAGLSPARWCAARPCSSWPPSRCCWSSSRTGLAATYRLVRRESEMARLKSDFVANVSHDLKTPLVADPHVRRDARDGPACPTRRAAASTTA